MCLYLHSILFLKKILFIFVYARSLLLFVGFLQLWQVVAPLVAELQLHLVAGRGHSSPAARGTLSHQGSNPCPLHWQADSYILRHQVSLHFSLLIYQFLLMPASYCLNFLVTVTRLLNDEIRQCKSSSFVLFQNYFGYCRSFVFLHTFQNQLVNSYLKNACWNFDWG